MTGSRQQIDPATKLLAILRLIEDAQEGSDGMLPPDVQKAINLIAGGGAPEKIPGGLGSGKSDADFDPRSLAAGQKAEMEHTNDPSVAREIARDHLSEDPRYYDKLSRINLSLEGQSVEEFFGTEPPGPGWEYCGNMRWVRTANLQREE